MNYLKKNLQVFLLAIILFAGIIIRLQNFYLPPIDAHPMRQTDTECIAYNFAYTDGNILHPKACLIRPIINKEGYFFLEFPLYQYILGTLYTIFGNGIVVARLFNLALYLIACISLHIFVKKTIGERIALISLFLFSFAPGSIFFIGHAIHPDIFATTTLLISLSLYAYYIDKKKRFLFIYSALFLSISVATRPFGLLVLPGYLYLLWTHKSKVWEYLTLIAGSGLIFAFWKLWQLRFPHEYFAWENWVLLGKEQLLSFDILVRRLIVRNVIGEVMGKIISILALFGTISVVFKRHNMILFSLLWLLGVPLYWFFVPNGNIVHQYYANVYIIPVVILASFGIDFIVSRLSHVYMRFSMLLLIFILVAYNGYRTSSYYFNDIDSSNYIMIAREIEKYIPSDAKIIYPATLNSVPLSLAHRQGWVIGGSGIDVDPNADAILQMRQYGAEYVVLGYKNVDINPLEVAKIKKNSDLVVANKWVTIYKL